MIARKILVFGIVIGVVWSTSVFSEVKEETRHDVPNLSIKNMYVETPHPLMVWLSGCHDGPELKAIGYPFDSLIMEPGIEYYMKCISARKTDEKILFPSIVGSPDKNLILIAKLIIEINQQPEFREGNKGTFLKEWIEKHRIVYEKPNVQYNSKNLWDNAELAAGFILAGNTGTIEDIIPFLECADRHIGIPERANAGFFLGAGTLSQFERVNRLREGVPSGKRINYWPAAKAIVSNPTVVVPLLQNVFTDPSQSDGARLRAVAFLLELAPSWLDGKLLTNLNASEKEALFSLVSQGYKYRCVLMSALGEMWSADERNVRRAYLTFLKMRP